MVSQKSAFLKLMKPRTCGRASRLAIVPCKPGVTFLGHPVGWVLVATPDEKKTQNSQPPKN